jgi:hypothetical protein
MTITDRSDFDVRRLTRLRDATVTVDLENGKTIKFGHAAYTAEGKVTPEEGEIEARFDCDPDDAEETGEPQDPAAAGLALAKQLLGKREWPVTIKLATPIPFGKNEMIEELVFQKGSFGVLKGMNLSIDRAPTFDELMVIASRLCGRSTKVIEAVDPDDADEVFNIALGFFGRCRGASKTLSD